MERLLKKITDRTAHVAVIGLGYVGLPLAVGFANAGYHVTGIDVDAGRVGRLKKGDSYIQDVPSSDLRPLVEAGRFNATTEFAPLAEADACCICVPTPLNKTKDPDVSFILQAARAVKTGLRAGQLIVLESTTYPGTTRELLLPMLEESGLKVGVDFCLAFSPERIDPGNATYRLKNTPRVVGGITPTCRQAAAALYSQVVDNVLAVSSTEAAEMTKLLENTFRIVNIGLVNEIAIMCDRLGINVWEVVEAAATKPYGFIPFYPGPGLGGHCIPVDPFYLSWKARQSGFEARFIELAGQVNGSMPYHVVNRVREALNSRRKSVRGSRVLVLGVAYKADIDDVRESPSLDILDILEKEGAKVAFCDPYVDTIHHAGRKLKATPFRASALRSADCVVIATAHKVLDYTLVAKLADTIVDSRNALKGRRTRGVFRL